MSLSLSCNSEIVENIPVQGSDLTDKNTENPKFEILATSSIKSNPDVSFRSVDDAIKVSNNESKHGDEECITTEYLKVIEIISGNQIKVDCSGILVHITYLGIILVGNDNESLLRAHKLNEFLDGNKKVTIDVYDEKLTDYGDILFLAEVFVGGQSVNLRLIESGLLNLGKVPHNFPRIELYEESYKRVFDKKNNKPLESLEDNKNKVEDIVNLGSGPGCGTLPCPPSGGR